MTDLELYKFEELVDKVNDLEQQIIGAYVLCGVICFFIVMFLWIVCHNKDE